MKKRLCAIILCATMVLSIVACSGSKGDTDSDSSKKNETTEESTETEKEEKLSVNRQLNEITYYLDEEIKPTFISLDKYENMDYSALGDSLMDGEFEAGGISYTNMDGLGDNFFSVLECRTSDVNAVAEKIKSVVASEAAENGVETEWVSSTENWNDEEWVLNTLSAIEDGENIYIDLFLCTYNESTYVILALYEEPYLDYIKDMEESIKESVEFTDKSLSDKDNYDVSYLSCDWIDTDDGREDYFGTYTLVGLYEQTEKDGEFVNKIGEEPDKLTITEKGITWTSEYVEEGDEVLERAYYIEDDTIHIALIGDCFDYDAYATSGVKKFKIEKDGENIKLISDDIDTSFLSYSMSRYEFVKDAQ